MNFAIRILFCSRFESFASLDLPSPFHTRFGIFNKLILRSSVRARFRVFCWLYNFFSLPHEIWSDIPLLFRTRFGMVLFLFRSRFDANLLIHWYFYPPPLGVRSWSLIHWFVRFTGPTLEGQSNLVLFRSYTWKTSQTWFCSGLTLESQSNLVLFRSYTRKPIKLVISTLSYVCSPGLTLHRQPCCVSDFVTLVCLIGLTTMMPILLFFIHLDLPPGASSFHHLFIYLDLPPSARQRDFKSSSVGIFENSDLVWILPSFSPKVFLKLLSGAQTSSLCIPISDKTTYIWCNVLCNVWSWMACLSI